MDAQPAPVPPQAPSAALCLEVLDALPAHIAVLDRDGVVVYANAAWQRFAGDGAPGLPAAGSGVGSNCLAQCAAAGDGLAAVLAGRQSDFSLEYPWQSPQGQRWFLMSASRLGLAGAVVTQVDITARKRLDVSLERLCLAQAAARVGIWEWDLRDGSLYWSPELESLYGVAAGGRHSMADWGPRVHPDDLPGIEAFLAKPLGDGERFELEFRIRREDDGEIRWVHSAGSARCDAAGQVVVLAGTNVDITERKRMEQALKDSEARYRAVVEAQTELISRLSSDGTLLFVNAVYCRFFGKRHDELVGSRWHPVAHPDDVAMIEAALAELSMTRPSVVIENRVFAGDGAVRWLQFVNSASFDAQGRIAEIQCVGRDITERKRAEAQMLTLLEENTRLGRELIRLQEQERAALAAELHDELSQQLTAIRAYAGAIERRARGADNPMRQDAKAIAAAAADIYAISHRLMEGLHPQILDSAGLAAALQAQLAGWPDAHPGIGIRLRLAGNVDTDDGQARIHMFRLAQECLTNALRHAGARRIRVFLGERRRGTRRWLRLVVRDDGVGMDTALPQSGYGLIVMRERARNMGGSLDVRSRPGQGARIAVDLPLND